MENKNIRNFCIISHVDHGKSTLADRFLEVTNTVSKKEMKSQYLDGMEMERERGITIKLQPVNMSYDLDGEKYYLNLIDTPGHVDFSYEVSRSLAAVEGAILLVDASQGIQAQTIANLHLAQKQNLEIIPVINKIDIKGIDIDSVKKELSEITNTKKDEIICISAKEGKGIEKVLKKVIEKVPSPKIDKENNFKSLIFDSFFDEYRGVIAYIRVFSGKIQKQDKIKLIRNKTVSEANEVGIFNPKLKPKKQLMSGDIGYIVTGEKNIKKVRVGDTITKKDQDLKPLPGYKEPQPMVFAGIYLKSGSEAKKLRDGLSRLQLNDSSLVFEPERFPGLGFGFRTGFLGLLHMDVIRERLEKEYDLDIVMTSPSVVYKVYKKDKEMVKVNFPDKLPSVQEIDYIEEPWVRVEIMTPEKYIGGIMDTVSNISSSERINFNSMKYVSGGEQSFIKRVLITYEIPLSILLAGFYDKIKSVSEGYASYSYEFIDYRKADVVKLDILVAHDKIPSLSAVVYKDESYQVGRKITKKLKEVLPRQMFEVKIQAAVGGNIIAAERIPAARKDVTAGLYGGDISRKKKLLKKQKKGKKKMKQSGKVPIPPKAYRVINQR